MERMMANNKSIVYTVSMDPRIEGMRGGGRKTEKWITERWKV